MADDFDYEDGGVLDMDDGWLYVEDDIELADELAEGQLSDPGYPGNNYENDVQGFEFDLYAYWDDLEYADDAYDDYGVKKVETTGNNRKHPNPKKTVQDKRQKTSAKGRLRQYEWEPEDEPVLFHKTEDRYQKWREEPPLLEERSMFTLLPDWKTRFASDNGKVINKAMPAAMKQAAEGEEMDDVEENEDEEEGDWEDDPEDATCMEAALSAALKAKLGTLPGMEDMDEQQFLKAMMKMMAGEGGEDAADELTNTLLGKVTSETGNDALSGWLSGQGVSLGDDDDASSVATTDVAGASKETNANMQNSPVDSLVSTSEGVRGGRKAMQMPLHSGSPTNSLKKRSAPADPAEPQRPGRKQKKVKFDVPSSSSELAQPTESFAEPPTSDDPLGSAPTVSDTKTRNAAATRANKDISEEPASKSRKKKAETPKESELNSRPVKRTRKRELDNLGPLPDAPSPAPPAKQTRSARARSGK